MIHEFRSNYNIDSIDCIINDLKQNRSSEIEGLETICTTTFYNYVKDGKIEGFSKTELPMYGKRKEKNDENKGKSDPKGISNIRPKRKLYTIIKCNGFEDLLYVIIRIKFL